MPRRTKPADEPFIPEPVLALPAPKHKHHREEDAYESLPGAVPNVRVTTEPLKRKLTAAEKLARKNARLEQQALAARYEFYLDLQLQNGGNKAEALATIFNMSIEEAAMRLQELHAEVRKGFHATSLSEELEKEDLSMKARVRILRQHAYSTNPAASLKAVDMANDLEGDRTDVGSFESYLRAAKAQTR